MHHYFAIYKPYKMLSQFAAVKKKRTLADLDFEFPEGTHALGRLDDNSEGLLLLTTDKSITAKLMHPAKKHERIYWVQVHGGVQPDAITQLENGISIILEGQQYRTLPCKVKVIETPQNLPARAHPVGTHFATTWLEMRLYEGKFHQIRKMTAAAGHQTMRLIRVALEDLSLQEFIPGAVYEYSEKDFHKLLRIQGY